MFTITRNEGRVALDKPQEAVINMRDIAFHLSRIRRFNAASDITIGIHSIVAERLAEQRGYSTKHRLQVLLHDAPETYLQDMIRPIKKKFPFFIDLETGWETQLFTLFNCYTFPVVYREIDEYLQGVEIAHQFDRYPTAFATKPIHDKEVFRWFDMYLRDYSESTIEAAFYGKWFELQNEVDDDPTVYKQEFKRATKEGYMFHRRF